jgi:hypothetical protein
VGRMQRRFYLLGLTLLLVWALVGCGGSPTPATTATFEGISPEEDQSTATPTPTPQPPTEEPPPSPTPTPTPTSPVVIQPTPTSPPLTSRCQGLAGQIEVKILVGPAEAVGLEPVAVGSVPFAVVSDQEPYLVEGSGALSYDNVLVQQWGTYAVTMDMGVDVSGECVGTDGSEQLLLTLEASGDQLVVVDAGEFYGEYPWSGTNTFPLQFPLQDGATVEGEGYTFILRLSGQ